MTGIGGNNDGIRDVFAYYRGLVPSLPNDVSDQAGLETHHPAEVNQDTTESRLESILGTKNYIVYNPLSSRWTWTNIKANPVEFPFVYWVGMVGYALALPIRITIFVVQFLKTIVIFFETLVKGDCSQLGYRMKQQALILAGATGELVAGVIGIVCPVAAYKLDEAIQSNQVIHSWYIRNYLSIWSFEILGRHVTENDIGMGGAGIIGGAGNEHRMELKKELVGSDIKYFKQAKEELGEYLVQDEIDGSMPEVLNMIYALGILRALAQGSSLGVFRDEALAKYTEVERENKQKILDGYVSVFENSWEVLAKKEPILGNFAAKIPIIGSFFQNKNNTVTSESSGGEFDADKLVDLIKYEFILSNSDESLREGIKEKIEAELQSLEKRRLNIGECSRSCREVIKSMHIAVNNFAQQVSSIDREMFSVLMQNVYKDT